MFILSVILDDVKIAILTAIRTLFLDLCTVIYKLIVYVMEIFFQLGEAKLLSDTTIQGIYTRIGLILGLFMIFRLMFAGIEYLINPDTMLDKQKGAGNLIKKVLIVVVLLGSTQFLFEKAYDIQHLLIEDNIIAKVILQKNVSTADDAGSELAYQLFSSFYVYDNNAPDTAENNFCQKLTVFNATTGKGNSESILRKQFKESPPNLNDVYYCIALTYEGKNYDGDKVDKFVINFSGLVATVVGIVVLWTLMVYTVQVGVRAIQLAYLQLIAPIPIMSYLMPKGDDILKKWGTQCLTTFLDFFIRLAILYFVVLIIQELDVQLDTIEYTGKWVLGTIYLRVVIIIALLIFAKRVPNLLKEIFPSMGGAASLSFGIKSPKQAIGDIPILGGMANKAIGHMGNMGKKAGGFVAKNTVGRAWAATGGRTINRMKANYSSNAEARKARYEYEDKLKDIDATYKKYGNDFEAGNYDKVFGDKDYITTYQNLQNAKEAAKAAYGENTYEYNEAIKPFKEAHEAQQAAKPILASREKALKSYANYHPTEKKPQWESNSSTQQSTNQTNAPSTNSRQTIDLPTAAQIVNDSNASYDEQIRAAEALDRATREREQRNNEINRAAQVSGDPNASLDDQIRAAEVLDRAARERNNKNN